MSDRIEKNGLSIDEKLVTFIESEAIPGTGVDIEKFWQGFATIIKELGPKNKILLKKREDMQSKIDEWHITNRGQKIDKELYKSFLLTSLNSRIMLTISLAEYFLDSSNILLSNLLITMFSY